MTSFQFWTGNILKKSLRFLKSLLNGGENCLVCDGNTFVFPLCKDCLKNYYFGQDLFSIPRCSLCGKYLISEKGLCMVCREKPVFCFTDSVFSFYNYELWNKEIMFKWKIQGIRSLSEIFARKVYDYLKYSGNDIIVPVPPREGKIKKHGWDQIEELCEFLEYRYRVKILRILQRNSKSEQKKLDRESRLNTIGKSYSILPSDLLSHELKKIGGVLPETVCILDDIITTGATIESCAEILKKGGIKRVEAVTIFSAS